MKKIIIVSLIGLLAISLFYTIDTSSGEERYLANIQMLKSSKLDGPEKSAYRDIIMTMNPKTGEVPSRTRGEVVRAMRGRSVNERDFQWEQINTEVAGRTRTIMIDPNDDTKLWAGAVTGGLWYTPDFRNNASWIPVSDDWTSMSIACMTHDPSNTDIFYVGTGESFTSVNIYRESSSAGAGIYKSTDGGTSWTLLPATTDFDYVNDIVVRNEGGTSVIYAAVASGVYQGSVFASAPSDGLYRSTDGGESWIQVLPNIEGYSVPYAVADLELADNGVLYAGTMRNLELEGGGVVLYSEDGLNWTVEDRYSVNIKEEGLSQYGLSLLPGRVKLASSGGKVYAASSAGWLNSFDQIRDHPVFVRMMYHENGTWNDLVGPTDNWASIPWHALALGVDPNDNNRIAIGGLDAYAISDTESAGELSWVRLSNWASMYYFSDYLIPYYGLQDEDSIVNHFVHADIHAIEYVPNSSDEVIFATDGGVYYTNDFSKAYASLDGERLGEYPTFGHINQSLATTQYYTIALHPDEGNNEVLVGSQDNSTHTSETGEITYESMIGGGDGAYCFFDRDDPSLRITSSQVNNYNFFINGVGNGFGTGTGSFINPAAYDDRSNLLYTNMAVDGGFEVLIPGLEGRYLDTLAIINVNDYLGKAMLGLPEYKEIRLGTGSTAAFSSLKISPHSEELDATMVLGNQLGDVYIVEGLPYSPTAKKIDADQLPVGYISAVDIGESDNEILVTFSNYGIESVWYTSNQGADWQNLERNLPDIPVRYGVFNPLDARKILIATEVGVWGLENILEESEEWKSYNLGLPNVRVDMLKARASDSVVALATHGRGVFLGKFNQGEPTVKPPLSSKTEADRVSVYPNPTSGGLNFSRHLTKVNVFGMDGKLKLIPAVKDKTADISVLNRGVYIIQTQDDKGRVSSFKIIKQ